MKLRLFAFSAMVALFGFTSCEDDSNDQNDLSPVVILDGTGDNIANDKEVTVGSTLNFLVSGSENEVSGKNLKNITITRVYDNDVETVLDSNISGSSFGPFTIEDSAQDSTGVEKWSFVITDKDGVSGTRVVEITTAEEVVPFTEEEGQFYHIAGSLKGSFDLVAGVELTADTANDAMRDMKNTDDAGAAFTGSWESTNGTQFKEAPFGYSFDNANGNNTALAYNAIIPGSTSVSNPAAGDVYLVKLRGGNTYAAVRIDSVDPDFNTGNKGKITFTFKR
jgi:hypothetical protein